MPGHVAVIEQQKLRDVDLQRGQLLQLVTITRDVLTGVETLHQLVLQVAVDDRAVGDGLLPGGLPCQTLLAERQQANGDDLDGIKQGDGAWIPHLDPALLLVALLCGAPDDELTPHPTRKHTRSGCR